MTSETNSETTGPVSLGSVVSTSIGPALGETTSESRLSAAAAKLCGQAVRETDAALQASLKQRCGLQLGVRTKVLYHEDGSFTEAVAETSLKLGQDAKLQDGVAMLTLAMTPAPSAKLAEALTRLRLITVGGQKADADTELSIELMIDLLRDYPADVAIETLAEWPRRKRGSWWPTWAELRPILDSKAAMRRAMEARVRQAWRNSL